MIENNRLRNLNVVIISGKKLEFKISKIQIPDTKIHNKVAQNQF